MVASSERVRLATSKASTNKFNCEIDYSKLGNASAWITYQIHYQRNSRLMYSSSQPAKCLKFKEFRSWESWKAKILLWIKRLPSVPQWKALYDRFELMRIYLQRELKIFVCEMTKLANSQHRTWENSCKQYWSDVYLRVHYEFIIIFVCWFFKYSDACPSYYPYKCKWAEA